jgi:hypothetical protein
MEAKMSQKKLPNTDSITELAEFWDTHDLTDTGPVFQHEPEVTIPISLRREEVEVAKRLARSLGTSYIDLIRGWIRERIHAS